MSARADRLRAAAWLATVAAAAGCGRASPRITRGAASDAREASAPGAAAPPWLSPGSSATPRPLFSVRCGVLWDPAAGAVDDGRIVVDGDRVAASGPSASIPRAPSELDLRPLFCMPGLVDAHTRLASPAPGVRADPARRQAEAAANALAILRSGVTSVRDLGAGGDLDIWLRAQIRSGAAAGPRMRCAGEPLGTGGPAGGPDAARKAVDQRVARGDDVIALIAEGGPGDSGTGLTFPELEAATYEAHQEGLRAAAQAFTPDAIRRAITAGVDSIEGAGDLTVQLARAMAAKGIYVVRAPSARGGVQAAPFTALLATGVKVALGSDEAGRALVDLVRAGMPPERALDAGTATAAALLGWRDEVGTFQSGAYADLLTLSGDPRRDIRAVLRPALVMKGGAVILDARAGAPPIAPAACRSTP